MYTYILINILSISIPLFFSFEKRVCYFKKWKYLFPAIFLVAVPFWIWDHYFTVNGVWGFNAKYLMGIYLFSLPLEEVLFFICIPFSSIFIYALVRVFQKPCPSKFVTNIFTYFVIITLLILALLNSDKIYTLTTFSSLAILLFIHIAWIREEYLGSFYQAYIITTLPFLIVNGLLTTGIRSIDIGPVVWYSNLENLSLHVVNIPIEDFAYSMLLLLSITTIYEFLQKKY